MQQVAKLIMIDPNGKHLMMYRANHPELGNDADLPGGIVEDKESMSEGVVREVLEEAGIVVDERDLTKLYAGKDYSDHGTLYSLFSTNLKDHPEITLSWEHESYEWLPLEEFLQRAHDAEDTYMRMVYDTLSRSVSVAG